MDVNKLMATFGALDGSGEVTAAVHERQVLLLFNGVPVFGIDRVQFVAAEPHASRTAKKRKVGNMVIDLLNREVLVGATLVKLTPMEFELLKAISDAKRVIAWKELHEYIWESIGKIHVVHAHLHNLRGKLKRARWSGNITTVPGFGVHLNPD